jgi:hypothetical protein
MQMSVDGFAQGSKGDRFSEHGVNGAWARAGDFDESAKASQQDDRQIGMQLFDQFSRLIAAHLWHGAIEKDDIEPILPRLANGLTPARCDNNVVSVAAQVLGHDFADTLVIVDDEDTEV